MTSRFPALVARVAAIATASSCLASCTMQHEASEPSLTLTFSAESLVADGKDLVEVSAVLSPAADDVVVSFAVVGSATLSASTVLVRDGRASTTLFAPSEERALARGAGEIGLTATAWLESPVLAEASLSLGFAEEGEASLSLRADPEQGVADGASTMTIALTALRVDDGAVVHFTTTAGALSSESAVVSGGVAEVTLTAPGAAATATVRATLDDGLAAALDVPFFPEDQPFDLNGTFAQVQYGRTKLDKPFVLDPSPQCVQAPSVSLVEVEQVGTTVTTSTRTCAIEFPTVKVNLLGIFEGTNTTTPGPGYIDALPVETEVFELDALALGSRFETRSWSVVGARDVGEHDELPGPNDPRLDDPDHDDEDGVTLLTNARGPQHIVFRAERTMKGAVVSSNEIDGSALGDIVSNAETSILNDTLARNNMPTTVSLPSVHQMVRVDGGYGAIDISGYDGQEGISCEDLIAAAADVFTLEAPDTPLDCTGL